MPWSKQHETGNRHRGRQQVRCMIRTGNKLVNSTVKTARDRQWVRCMVKKHGIGNR